MTTAKPNLVHILRSACQRNDAGRHFTEWLDWQALEKHGLIEIVRPVHAATGMSYEWTRWRLMLTPAGERLASSDWFVTPSEWSTDEYRSVLSVDELVTDAAHLWADRKLADTLNNGLLIESENKLDAIARAIWLFGDDIDSEQVQELRDAIANKIEETGLSSPEQVFDVAWQAVKTGCLWRRVVEDAKLLETK